MTDESKRFPTEDEIRAAYASEPGFGDTIRMMLVEDHNAAMQAKDAEIARLTAALAKIRG